ncbi:MULTISPECIES: hypothetical protein [Serratia]|jgi:hypothetical protein|uniref:Uncharacterized protein n=1 Tax=Serratia marcescens TaxID=615 RepID=A0AAP8TR86_SERMA|nr:MULTISPECIES: hypothetical protein [Serratia]RNW15167.1 hypothetical protein CAG37_003160 [Serratia nematodiphila]APS35769.1 hypothetical protein RN42_18890 [Serratia marcescens]EIG9086320.1 hypothetical protein [Serratia marcescens]ELQ9311066.1 hypothetical protein [Serratia marcescens]ELQ9440870.1 hypothetical protein [Serratia marcescens]
MPLEVDGIIRGDRGSEPSRWQHASTKPLITLTWHHTIPWNCLRNVWNGLVAGQHWDALDEFMNLIGVPNRAEVLKQIKNKNLQDRDGLHTLVTWQGWNIVEGPGNEYRAQGDDPGENFDGWSGKGMSTNQQATQQQVNVLYRVMEPLGRRALDAARQAPPITAKEAGILQRTIKQTRPTLRGKEPIRWQEDMWHQVQSGKEAKHFARWDTKPVWRKRLHSDLAQAG